MVQMVPPYRERLGRAALSWLDGSTRCAVAAHRPDGRLHRCAGAGAADQISKALVVAAAPHGSRGGLVSVRLVRNTGASFGIGAGHPVLITVIAAAVLAAAVIWLVRTRRPGAALCMALVAGARRATSPTGCCGHGDPAGARWWTGFMSPVTPPRSISRTWQSAPERSAPWWRRWLRAAGKHAARQQRGATSFAGEPYDAAERADDPESLAAPCPALFVRPVLTCFSRSAQ
jgi:hypothetical protein